MVAIANLDIDMSNITVGSLNVRGLNNKLKRSSLYHKIRMLKYTVFFMQEIYSSQHIESIWGSEWGGKYVINSGNSSSKGVGIFFNSRATVKIKDQWMDKEGRVIVIKVDIDDREYVLANLYAPNQDNPDFFNRVFEQIDNMCVDNIIIGGDWNLVLDMIKDSEFRGNNNYRSVRIIEQRLEEMKLSDIWRIKNLEKKQYTWFRRKQLCKSRLDFFLISDNLIQFTEHTSINADTVSDHARIDVRISIEKVDRGPGWWKFNNQLLSREDKINEIKGQIRVILWELRYVEDEFEKWELFKDRLRTFCIKMGKAMKKAERDQLTVLRIVYTAVHTEMINNNGETNTVNYLQQIKGRIHEIEAEEARAAAFRARVRWVRDGDRCSKYFCALEKRNYMAKSICKIQTEGGEITERRGILSQMQSFYKELYQEDRDIVFDIVNSTDNKAKSEDLESLNSEITMQECEAALAQMQTGKAPGCDGLSTDFYKIFWTDIKETLYAVYLKTQGVDKLNPTARRGIVFLIPKKGKEPTLLKNWRPLTLLNTDYKILAKVMANRIKPVLQYVIAETQTGFMEGRHIGENIRRTMDLVSHVSKNKKEALLISLDYEKCFDKIAHNAVFGAIKYFELGEYFEKMIRVFFN